MQAASRPSGRSASAVRRLSVEAVGWLRSDLVDVVSVFPGNPAQSELGAIEEGRRSTAQLDEALARWGRRLARERLFVLAPRGLSLALGLGALIALAIAVSGSTLNLAVVLCLSVPPLFALAVVLAGSWRDPSQRQVARVFDRDLALDERLGTAVEISGAGNTVDGLAGLVVAEANAALATSHLSGVRPTHTSAHREWLVSAGALLITALLLVLIAGRGESPGLGRLVTRTPAGSLAASTSVPDSGRAKHEHKIITGRSRNIGPDQRRQTAPSPQSAGRTPALSVVKQPQSAAPGGRLSAGGGNQRTPSESAGRSGSQSADLGAKSGTRSAGGGAARPGSSSSAQVSKHAAGSARGGRAASNRRTTAGGHASNPQRVGTGSRAARFESNRATSSRGSAKAPAGGNSQAHGAGQTRSPSGKPAAHAQRSPGGQGHSVGNSAGAGSGGNPFGRPQTTRLPSGSARLPIQAGYTPVRGKSGPRSGRPARGSGGVGRARTLTESGGGSATAVTLPYIPPSADIGNVDNALLQSYFSPARKLSTRW